MFVSKIFNVAFLILFSLKTNCRYDTCWTITFQFLDHIKFSNIVLNIWTGNQSFSVNVTHFNIYFKQKKHINKADIRNWLKFWKLIRISRSVLKKKVVLLIHMTYICFSGNVHGKFQVIDLECWDCQWKHLANEDCRGGNFLYCSYFCSICFVW